MNRSTPPSSSPSTCSRNAARIAASSRWSSSRVGRAERADRAGDEGFPTRDVASLPGDLGGAAVEPAGLARQAERGEPDPVRSERRGLDDLGAGRRGTRGGSRR